MTQGTGGSSLQEELGSSLSGRGHNVLLGEASSAARLMKERRGGRRWGWLLSPTHSTSQPEFTLRTENRQQSI